MVIKTRFTKFFSGALLFGATVFTTGAGLTGFAQDGEKTDAAAAVPADSELSPAQDESKTQDTKPQESKTTADDDKSRPDFRQGKLTFTFKNTEWGKVIRWFADEAKLDLNMPVTPEGSFNYVSNGEFTLLEAMDVINSFLIREQGYILIRHANLIFVHDLNVEIPPTMIETIENSDLDNRGEFELTQTEFDIRGIDADTFSSEIERLVRDDQGGKQMLLTSSELLFVRETGGRLRLIRKYLDMARQIAQGRSDDIKIIELKFTTPEEVMVVASELIPLDDENSFVDDDAGEKLKVVVQSFGNKFILKGTSKTVERFEKLVALLDKKAETTAEASELAVPATRRYPVATDRELVLQVLRTMLAGTEGLRLALAEEAGEIVAYATPEQHAVIEEILGALTSDATDFKVIRLNEYDADSIIEILNKMFGISDAEGETADPNAPVFMADPLYSDQMIARGKPAQLAAIEKLVVSIDPPVGAGSFESKNYLQLDYRGKKAEQTIQMIQEYFEIQERPNKIKVLQSNAAKSGLDKINRIPADSSGDADSSSGNGFQSSPGRKPEGASPAPETPKDDSKAEPKSDEPAGNQLKTTAVESARKFYLVSATLPVQDQEKKTDDESKQRTGDLKTVPGAPIVIRESAAGLFIISDDLAALAEIKNFLKDQEEILDRPGLPTIIELKYRKAVEMKDLLKMFLGLSSDSGGGGGGAGGIGGMIGGMAQNAIGGAAGQMLGGLLGGGGGGGDTGVTASDLLTGDVRIDADAQKNVLLVQANEIDLETILEYVNYFDTDGPDQDPNLDGRTYTIPVKFRDAAELAEIIKTQLAERIKAPPQQRGGQANNQQAEQMKILQQLMGRGGRGGGAGGGSTVEQTEPKMTVGVDAAVNAVLVTGPEFLYIQVRQIIEALDTELAQADSSLLIVPLKSMSSAAVKSMVESIQTETQQSGSTRTTGTTASSGATAAPAFNPAMFLNRGGATGGGATGASPFGAFGRGGATFGRGGGATGGGGRGGGGGGRGGR